MSDWNYAEGGDVPVKEDFFQRIVNVSWQHEPPCYWWGCDDTGLLNLQNRAAAREFRSNDGKNWTGYDSPNFCNASQAMWFRQGFVKKGKPTWLMGGAGKLGGPYGGQSLVCYSFDGGKTPIPVPLDAQSKYNPDGTYAGPTEVWSMGINFNYQDPPSSTIIVVTGRYFGINTWTSKDGITWKGTPNDMHYYPFVPQLPGAYVKDICLCGGSFAYGGIKDGHTLSLYAIEHPDYSHFLSSFYVSREDGKSWQTDSGLIRGESVNYGHYVFTVNGSMALQEFHGQGKIRWTEDGRTWYTGTVGEDDRIIWAMACGPRGKDKMFPSGTSATD